MNLGWRSTAQLALVAAGAVIWGYGARFDVSWARLVGIGCFAAAVVLLALKDRTSR